MSVRLVGIGASSLQVEVNAWFALSSWDEFQVHRQDLLLAFLEVVERAGTALAFPTQTVHLAGAGQPSTKNEGPALAGPSNGGADRDRTDDL